MLKVTLRTPDVRTSGCRDVFGIIQYRSNAPGSSHVYCSRRLLVAFRLIWPLLAELSVVFREIQTQCEVNVAYLQDELMGIANWLIVPDHQVAGNIRFGRVWQS